MWLGVESISDLIFAAPPHQELGAKRHFLFFLSPHYLRYAHCTEMDVLFFFFFLIDANFYINVIF